MLAVPRTEYFLRELFLFFRSLFTVGKIITDELKCQHINQVNIYNHVQTHLQSPYIQNVETKPYITVSI